MTRCRRCDISLGKGEVCGFDLTKAEFLEKKAWDEEIMERALCSICAMIKNVEQELVLLQYMIKARVIKDSQ